MKKGLLGVFFVLITGMVFGQERSMEVNFWPKIGLDFSLVQNGSYQLFRQKKENGNFFLLQITGKDKEGKNQYAKNALIFAPMAKIKSSGRPIFATGSNEIMPVTAILSSAEEYGMVVFDLVLPMEARGVIMTSSIVTFVDTAKYNEFAKVVAGMKEL